jgi:dihydroxyacetone kinase
MVDCWMPVCEAAQTHTHASGADAPLTEAFAAELVSAAQAAAEAAKHLPAKKGRARYSNGREVGKCEPGCELVVLLMQALALAVRDE